MPDSADRQAGLQGFLLQRTLIYSYLAQAYVALIGIVLMPLYLKYLGAESFGLIGIFLMLQAWLQLLDLGLSPTLSREMSRYRAGALDIDSIWQRLRSLEWLFALVAVVITAVFVLLRERIVHDWFAFEQLQPDEVTACFVAMVLAAALRWLTGLYRSALTGLERQTWVNGAGVLFSTLKFVAVLPLLIYWSSAPLTFFSYQVVAGIIELMAYRWRIYRVLPGVPATFFAKWEALREMLPMAGAMGSLTGIWIFLTQIDKLVLSSILPLEEYGHFTLAVALAGSILAMIPPLTQVLQPRMTILVSQGADEALQHLYRIASQATTIMFVSVGGGVALFAQPLLLAWTGDEAVAQSVAPILFWYGLANAMIGVLILPYMLQFAHGQLRLHIIGNVLLALTLLPMLVYASLTYGAIGAGVTLLLARIVFLVFWVPLVHKKFMPDLVITWPLRDIAPVMLAVLGVLSLAYIIFPDSLGRVATFVLIAAVVIVALLAGLLSGSLTRGLLMQNLGKRI